MKTFKLGKTSVDASRLCLGCMGFGDSSNGVHGWTLPYEESKEIIAYALEKGINFFDTAMVYQGGSSEVYLGKAIKELAKREEVVIATKFMPRSKDDIEQGISGQQHVRNCLEASLERLQMEYVDLYIYHMWDDATPIEEYLEGLHQLVVEGKIKAIGISNCYSYQLAKANAIARFKRWTPFVSMQSHYNLIFREDERELVKLCKEENIAMTPYSVLASGRLARPSTVTSQRLTQDFIAQSKYDAMSDQDAIIIQRVEELSLKKEVSMSEISLGWLLQKVEAPIVGATKKKHIDDAIKALDVQLSKDEAIYLEELYVPHRLVGVMASRN